MLGNRFRRGRYSYAMYKQMLHTDLIASNVSHYTHLVMQLVSNRTFRDKQAADILRLFHMPLEGPNDTNIENNSSKRKVGAQGLNKNNMVATEWNDFFINAWRLLFYRYKTINGR